NPKSKRDRYWLYKREEPMDRIPIERHIGCKNNQKEQVMSTRENTQTLATNHRSRVDVLQTTMKTKNPFKSTLRSRVVQMKKHLASACICGMMIVIPAVSVSAQVPLEACASLVNPSFETGNFVGWTATPGASIIGLYQDRNYLPEVRLVSSFSLFQAKLT